MFRSVPIAAAIGAIALIANTVTAAGQSQKLVGAVSATHSAILLGANVVPAVATGATAHGTAWLIYDPQTRELRWTVEYSGLSGPVRGGHLHGPAGPEANADIFVNLGTAPMGFLNSPINGIATLSEAQAEELEGGHWYVDLRTDDNPGGEVRGQILPVQ